MDALFSEEEMSRSGFSRSCFGKTKLVKPQLPEQKVKLLEGIKLE